MRTVLTAFYNYPVELCTIIYTTKAVEELNAQLRMNTFNRKVFSNDDEAIKILYLTIRKLTKKWTKRHGWDMLMNQFTIHVSRALRSRQEWVRGNRM